MRYLSFLLLIIIFSCKPEKLVENQNFNVGTKSYKWSDSNRIDNYYGNYRLINVQIWYPIDATNPINTFSSPQYYYEIDNTYKSLENWTEEDYQIISKVPVNSLVNYPISEAKSKFPVLIFSPSLGGNISQYTYYAEHLAKSGFIVVGVNHLYESEYAIDNKMNVFPSNLKFHDSLKTLDIPKQISAEKYREAKGERQLVLGEDLVFCLNKLEEINQNEFNGQLDLQKVGAWGHSIGGAAAIYASVLDERFKAILNLDGTPPSIALKNGIKVPFMFIEDLTDYENHNGYKKMHKRRSSFCKINDTDSYRILIGETNHNSFLSINYHLTQNKEDKKIVLNVIQKTEQFMNQFFSHYLKSKEMNLQEIKTDSLEIIKYIKS